MTKQEEPIQIRLAHAGELDEIGRITVAAYRGLDGFLDGDAGYEAELLNVASRARDAEVFVAAHRGHLLGAMTYVPDRSNPLAEWPDVEAAGMRMLAIDPAQQGRGIGRLMTEFALERSRALGQEVFLLHSASFMTAAHGLYESMGFRRYTDIDFTVEQIHLWGFRLDL